MRAPSVILCAVVCALLYGCGSIGEPLYPALKIPTRVTDLGAVERGNQIDVTFTTPPLTTEGLAIKTHRQDRTAHRPESRFPIRHRRLGSTMRRSSKFLRPPRPGSF